LPEGWADATGFEIWEEHLPAWDAFLAVDGQWRGVPRGMGGVRWIGLDYTAVKVGLEFAGIAMTPEIWADFRLIEAGACEELNRDQ